MRKQYIMTLDEALDECERWFAHLNQQRTKSVRIQQLASLARTGPEGHAQAKKELRQIDKHPKVYNGDRLEEAVKVLHAFTLKQLDFLEKL